MRIRELLEGKFFKAEDFGYIAAQRPGQHQQNSQINDKQNYVLRHVRIPPASVMRKSGR